MSRLCLLLCCAVLVACHTKTPAVADSPAVSETINGTERVSWDQPAADTVELATIRYAIYIDGVRSELAGVSCASAPTSAGFACSARLPALSDGSHAFQIAAFVNRGTVRESAGTATLIVNVDAAARANAGLKLRAIR